MHYEEGDCLRCEQNKEYEESLRADAAAGSLPDVISVDPMLGSGSSHAEQVTGSIQAQAPSDHEEQPVDLNEVRARLSRGDSEVKNSGDNPNSDFDDLPPSGLILILVLPQETKRMYI